MSVCMREVLTVNGSASASVDVSWFLLVGLPSGTSTGFLSLLVSRMT